jgi:hypothetical protein
MLHFWLPNIASLIVCVSCVNTFETAAIFGFPLKIKVTRYPLLATAAPAWPCYLVAEVSWNDIVWMHGQFLMVN